MSFPLPPRLRRRLTDFEVTKEAKRSERWNSSWCSTVQNEFCPFTVLNHNILLRWFCHVLSGFMIRSYMILNVDVSVFLMLSMIPVIRFPFAGHRNRIPVQRAKMSREDQWHVLCLEGSRCNLGMGQNDQPWSTKNQKKWMVFIWV